MGFHKNQFKKSDNGKKKLPESREETCLLCYKATNSHCLWSPVRKHPVQSARVHASAAREHGARRRFEVFKLMFHFVCNLVCE